MSKRVLKRVEIEALPGEQKQHFLNDNARRLNRSLGDRTGLTGLGFHIIEVPPGCESTEYHVHRYEDECTYVLGGEGEVTIGDETISVGEGDFVGYPAGGEPHTMRNTGDSILRCIVVGQRLDHDISDYPRKNKRLYRNTGQPWALVDIGDVTDPNQP